MKKRLYVLFITVFILCWMGGCNNTDQSPPASSESSLTPSPSDLSPKEVYLSVLQDKAPFFSIDANKELNISQLNQTVSDNSSVTTKVTKFAIVNLENDDIPEVILWLSVNNNNDYRFEILRYQDGLVYGYTLPYRSFMDLKDDGSFSFSSGAADFGYGTMELTEKGYTINRISYSESVYDSNNNQIISYFVNNESATNEDFLTSINEQSEKTGATWYDYNDDNMEKILSAAY